MIENMNEKCFIKASGDSFSNIEFGQVQKFLDVDKYSEMDMQRLSLDSRGISKLPKSVVLDNFVSISLEGNVFCELPLEICSLGSLKFLNVAKNKIKLFPDEVGNLSNLEYLNCSENLLEKLPTSLSMVSKLIVLNASKNSIMSIPDELRNLERLEHVNLSHNKLKEVPIALVFGSKFIYHLDLSHNWLKDFSKEPKCSASLKSLKVNNNALGELPVWMRCLQSVEELYLGDNNFKCAPHRHPLDDMMPLPSVTMAKLSINSCGLKNLPISLKHMKNLIYLDAGNGYLTINHNSANTIWDLTPSLSLSYLKELRLPYVGLSVLPKDFWTCLNKLEILDLEGNAVMWLPGGVSSHIYLTGLILSCNRLALLPSEIGAVKSLKELRLDRNKLHELPDTIGNLENLMYMDLYDNELSEFPLSIGNLHHLKFLDLELNHFIIDESSRKIQAHNDDPCNNLYRALEKKEQTIGEFFFENDFLSAKIQKGVFEEIPADYVAMRENLRTRFLPNNNRLTGSKEPQSCSISDIHSCNEESESSSLESDYQPDLEESIKNCSIAEEEDWDKSDDSDNFYDPEYSQALKNSIVRSQWHWARDNGRWEPPVEGDVFCPADIHPDSIPRPSKKEKPAVNDGQFDDVDDDSS